MKEMIRKNLRTILTVLVSVILSSGITAFAAIKISATEIGYNNTTVADQLDSIYQTMFSNNYSTEEKQIGKWIDGKPVYQKTYEVKNVTAGSYSILHNISDMDKVVDIRGTNGKGRPIPYAYGGASSEWYAGCDINGDYLRIEIGTNYIKDSNSIYVTIQYTKTTDEPITQ